MKHIQSIALAALLQDTHKPVYQCGTSDVNGVSIKRLIELSSLYKRRHWEKENKNPALSFIMRHYEAVPITPEQFQIHGSAGLGRAAKTVAWAMKKAAIGPMAKPVKTIARAVDGAEETFFLHRLQ